MMRFLEAPPGVIAFVVSGDVGGPYSAVLVAFNATKERRSVDGAPAGAWALHPALAAGADATVKTAAVAAGTVLVPPYTAAVFVL